MRLSSITRLVIQQPITQQRNTSVQPLRHCLEFPELLVVSHHDHIWPKNPRDLQRVLDKQSNVMQFWPRSPYVVLPCSRWREAVWCGGVQMLPRQHAVPGTVSSANQRAGFTCCPKQPAKTSPSRVSVSLNTVSWV